MLRIVLPAIVRAAISVSPVGAVVVIHESIVPVDIDVVIAAPTGIPAPAAATPCGSNGNSRAERKQPSSCRGVPGIRHHWVRIIGRAPYHFGSVTGNIDHLWTGRLNNDHGLVLNHLGLNFLLFG